MKEPSLLDVVKKYVTGPRVVRGGLALVGLYLAYRGVAAMGLAQALPAIVVGLGVLLVVGALWFRQPLSWTAPTVSASWPRFRPSLGPRIVPRDLLVVVYIGVGLGLAYMAQVHWFKNPQQPGIGWVLWAVAVVCWVPVLRAWSKGAEVAATTITERRVHRRLALAGLVVGVAAYGVSGGHIYTSTVVISWTVSVVLWCIALLGVQVADLRTGWARVSAWLSGLWANGLRLRLSWLFMAFIAILALGTFLRFYQLNDVPREMTSDHVEKLLDVNDVLHGQFSTFFPRNTGREPLQFYFVALLIRVLDLPLAHIALKVSTAIAGSVTLIFAFLLARELAGNEVGLLTMLLMAVARWPIAMSRAGLRYPFNPLFVAPTFYFLARGLKSSRRSDFVWAGLCMAAGLHGYTPFRVVPFAILGIGALWLAWDWLKSNRNFQAVRRQALNLGAMFSVTALACVPLFRYMNDNPQMFWYRALSRVGTTEQPIAGNVLTVIVNNVYRAMMMFNLVGDQVWTVNISNWPTLSSLMAALFGLGFIFFVVRAVRGDRWALLVLVAWFLCLMPSAGSLAFPGENPSVVRAGGSAPFVFLMAAWPLELLRREVVKRLPGLSGRVLAAGALIVIVGITARTDFYDYFVTFRQQYAQSATNPSEVAVQIRAFVAAGGDPSQVWLKGYPYWLDTRAISLEAFGSPDWQNAMMDVDKMTAIGSDPRAKFVIVHIWDRPAIAKLRELYPQGILAYHTSPTPGKDFLTYFVPGTKDFDENTLPPPP